MEKQRFLFQMQLFELLPGPETRAMVWLLCVHYLCPGAEFAYNMAVSLFPVFHVDGRGLHSCQAQL